MEGPRLAKLATWAPPLLLCLVASVQLAASERSPLTRWRGGGFGMYAEIHPDARRVWIEALPLGCAGTDAAEGGPGPEAHEISTRLHRAQRAASRASLEALVRAALAGRDLAGCREVTGELFAPELVEAPLALTWRSLRRVSLGVGELE